MSDLTAARIVRDARTRLIVAADGHPSYRGPYDPDRITSTSCDLLWRWALANAHGRDELDDRTRDQLDRLLALAKGDAGLLDDARAAGGVGALLGDDEPPVPTVDEITAHLDGLIAEVTT